VCVDDDEREYCKTSRVSLDKLFQSHIGATGETGLVEQILKLLRVKHVSPIGLSQQYATQKSAPNKIYYVKGGWQSCFRISVEATEPQCQQEFLSIEIRVCPAALLEHVRLTHTPALIFSEVFSPFHGTPYSIPCGISCCSALKTAGFNVTSSSDQHIRSTHHWDFPLCPSTIRSQRAAEGPQY